jgi:cytidine deaminase
LKSIDKTTAENLLTRARAARENAYAPYSGFRVGAALLARDGRVFEGCNVENVSFGAVSCAERNAVYTAVAAGCRDFEAIAVAAGNETVFPCGICRQVLGEFSPNILVLCGNKNGYELYSLPELLPHTFRL